MAPSRGPEHGRPLPVVLRLHFGAGLQQGLDRPGMTARRSCHQRRPLLGIPDLDVGTATDQGLDHGVVAVTGGQDEGELSLLSLFLAGGIGVGPLCQEFLDGGVIPFPRGIDQVLVDVPATTAEQKKRGGKPMSQIPEKSASWVSFPESRDARTEQ